LNELASDLWWSWNASAREVFRDLDLPLWRFTDHNPVLLLHLVEAERLEHAAGDPAFLRFYDEAVTALDAVRAGAGTWWSRRGRREANENLPFACLAAGFSLHQALPLDSDDAAIAAGDAAKEASDLGLPFVGIGMMYPRAYLHQRIAADGSQQDTYEHLDWSDAPIAPALCPDGSPCLFSQPIGGQVVHARVWQVRVGRVTLFLIDTDVPENDDDTRALSAAVELPGSRAFRQRADLLTACAPRLLTLLGIQTCAVVDAAAIGSGVHAPTWMARDVAALVEQHGGADWRERQDDAGWWAQLPPIADDALWNARQRLRGYLLDFIRERARRRWSREQATGARLVGLGTLLDHATLTIGVVGRFTAGYAGEAVFHDVERLTAILTAARRPVQIIFAGRAHRNDEAGKEALQRIFLRALDPRFAGRIAFLDDYDLHAARLLVQGCDLCLSLAAPGETPLATAMASLNGVPVLALDPALPARAAARELYSRLEDDIVPVFYHRDRRGVPVEWVARVERTLRTSVPAVCARPLLKRSVERGAARADV
jgi:glucan phosphorylase